MSRPKTVILRRQCITCDKVRTEEFVVPEGAVASSVGTHVPDYQCIPCRRLELSEVQRLSSGIGIPSLDDVRQARENVRLLRKKE